MKVYAHKDTYTNIHSSFIYSSQKLETQMDKLWYIHNMEYQ